MPAARSCRASRWKRPAPRSSSRSRTTVTDAEGVYRIIDLRPGTYTVTFTLPGILGDPSRRHRAERELHRHDQCRPASRGDRAGRHRDRRQPGGRRGQHREAGDRHAGDAGGLPISKSLASFTAVVPGLQGARDIGGVSGDRPIGLTIHGSRGNDQHVFYNGMRTNNMNAGGSTGGGGSSSIYYNPAMIQEITLEVSAQSVASETGGVTVNVIPKEGGNMFNALVILNGTNGALQQNNLNDELRQQGVTTPQENKVIWDFNPGGGGPIARNKLWYYAAYRWWGTEVYLPGAFFNGAPDSLDADTGFEPACVRREHRAEQESPDHVAGRQQEQAVVRLREPGSLPLFPGRFADDAAGGVAAHGRPQQVLAGQVDEPADQPAAAPGGRPGQLHELARRAAAGRAGRSLQRRRNEHGRPVPEHDRVQLADRRRGLQLEHAQRQRAARLHHRRAQDLSRRKPHDRAPGDRLQYRRRPRVPPPERLALAGDSVHDAVQGTRTTSRISPSG